MNRPPDGTSGGAAVWDAGSRRLGYAIRQRIAALDPVNDNEEAAGLTLEVLYGDTRARRVARRLPEMQQTHKRFAISDDRKLF